MGESLLTVEGVPDFWTCVRAAPHRLLGLDYDGTLAPFHVIREAATPVPGAIDALKVIEQRTDTDLIVITGRSAREVRRLLGNELRIPIIGAHGYEVLHADESLESLPPNQRQAQGLARARDAAVSAGFEERLENKVSSVALHTRELPNSAEVETTIEELWRPLTQKHELVVVRFNGGVELRAQGRNKGVAFAAHYATMPLDTLAVYIGDDTTDEDVFQYLRPIGIGIKVGDPQAETQAAGRLKDPSHVLRLLQDWQAALRLPDEHLEEES